MKFFKRIDLDTQAIKAKDGYMVYYSNESESVIYKNWVHCDFKISTNGDGSIYINYGSINEDGFLTGGYGYVRDPKSDVTISEKTYYAFSCLGLYLYLDVDLSDKTADTELNMPYYEIENGEITYDSSAYGEELLIKVVKYNPSYDGPLATEIKYSAGDNQTIVITDDVINFTIAMLDVNTTLTALELPKEITSIDDFALMDCQSLVSVTLPETIKSIGQSAFDNCSSLSSITIPNSVQGNLKADTFQDCTSLVSVVIGDGISTIKNSCFYNCSSLKSIEFGKGLKTLESNSFYGTPNVTYIKYNGTMEEWENISRAKEWYNVIPTSTPVHCTDGDASIV